MRSAHGANAFGTDGAHASHLLNFQDLFGAALAAIEKEEEEEAARNENSEEDEGLDEDVDAIAAIRDAAMGKDTNPPAPEGNAALVVECTSCGYTLFVAKGREAKFFGPTFKCPECGATKETFSTRPQA